jgi:hypothetical protein
MGKLITIDSPLSAFRGLVSVPSTSFCKSLCAAAFGLVSLTLPTLAAEVRAVAKYTLTLGGTQIATANVSLDDTGDSYSMAVDAKISGLAQLVANGTARMQSTGSSNGSSLRSQKFDITTHASGEDFSVAITYASGGVASFVVTPPIVNNINRVAIERKHLTAANDMAASFVLKGGTLDKSLCDRKLQIFTGVERFNLSMRYTKDDVATSKRTGYQGPLVLCSVKYTPISGHYTTSEVTTYLAASERILIWYAPLAAPGYFIPYRAIISTEAGDLSVVLTDLQQ